MKFGNLLQGTNRLIDPVKKRKGPIIRTGKKSDNRGVKAHNKKNPAQPTEVEPDKGEKR